MKKKKNPVVIIIIILAIVLGIIIYLYISPTEIISLKTSDDDTETTTDSSISTAKVTTQTIENTLSSSGQINTALDEKVYLYASYYFEELLVDENVYISEGENILEYTNGTYLTAPYDCVLVSYQLPEEDEICTTSHYVELYAIDTLSMSLQVSESEINKVEIGDEVDITISATNQVLTGYIVSISEVGTYSSSGSYFTATVEFENDGTLKIGMSATCEIIIEKVENVIAVPIEAIQTSDDEEYVVVVNSNGNTSNVPVETGISNDAYIEIKSGLTGNETVEIVESTSSDNTLMRGSMPGGTEFNGDMQMPGGGNNGGNIEMPNM